jgi:hypothetical protein
MSPEQATNAAPDAAKRNSVKATRRMLHSRCRLRLLARETRAAAASSRCQFRKYWVRSIGAIDTREFGDASKDTRTLADGALLTPQLREALACHRSVKLQRCTVVCCRRPPLPHHLMTTRRGRGFWHLAATLQHDQHGIEHASLWARVEHLHRSHPQRSSVPSVLRASRRCSKIAGCCVILGRMEQLPPNKTGSLGAWDSPCRRQRKEPRSVARSFIGSPPCTTPNHLIPRMPDQLVGRRTIARDFCPTSRLRPATD